MLLIVALRSKRLMCVAMRSGACLMCAIAGNLDIGGFRYFHVISIFCEVLAYQFPAAISTENVLLDTLLFVVFLPRHNPLRIRAKLTIDAPVHRLDFGFHGGIVTAELSTAHSARQDSGCRSDAQRNNLGCFTWDIAEGHFVSRLFIAVIGITV